MQKRGSAELWIFVAFAVIAVGLLFTQVDFSASPTGDAHYRGHMIRGYGGPPPIPVCGNGRIEPPEQCDPPRGNCGPNCRWIRTYR